MRSTEQYRGSGTANFGFASQGNARDARDPRNNTSKDPFEGSILLGKQNTSSIPQSHHQQDFGNLSGLNNFSNAYSSPVEDSRKFSSSMNQQSTRNNGMSPLSGLKNNGLLLSPDGINSLHKAKVNTDTPGLPRSAIKRPPLNSILDSTSRPAGTPGLSMQQSGLGALNQSSILNSPYPLKVNGIENESTYSMNRDDGSFINNSGAKLGNSQSAFRNAGSMTGRLGFNSNLRASNIQFDDNIGLDNSVLSEHHMQLSVNEINDRSPLLLQQAPAMDRLEAAWCTWVIVYGYSFAATSNHSIIKAFQKYGDIESYYPSTGNWIFIKYETPIQAERACHQNSTFLNPSTLIGVSQMNRRLANYMNVTLTRDGHLTSTDGTLNNANSNMDFDNTSNEQPNGIGLGGSSLRMRSKAGQDGLLNSKKFEVPSGKDGFVGESDGLYLKPYRRKSICTRIMEYFFSY
eukprot:gene5896-8136_t